MAGVFGHFQEKRSEERVRVEFFERMLNSQVRPPYPRLVRPVHHRHTFGH